MKVIGESARLSASACPVAGLSVVAGLAVATICKRQFFAIRIAIVPS